MALLISPAPCRRLTLPNTPVRKSLFALQPRPICDKPDGWLDHITQEAGRQACMRAPISSAGWASNDLGTSLAPRDGSGNSRRTQNSPSPSAGSVALKIASGARDREQPEARRRWNRHARRIPGSLPLAAYPTSLQNRRNSQIAQGRREGGGSGIRSLSTISRIAATVSRTSHRNAGVNGISSTRRVNRE